jgi:ribulose-5-phosphate 4-epimerase/fuculose-1-phosphate aldolase
MAEQEGVIKYHLEHNNKPLPPAIDFSDLNSWRSIMIKLEMIGQTPDRYKGLGFGNISQRLEPSSCSFLISGTQTGDLDPLSRQDFCIVVSTNPATNSIISEGPCKPSSEALTHASVYLERSKTQVVIHGHCPAIWKNTRQLNLSFTEQNIAYGTPEMAQAVSQLIRSRKFNSGGIFSMLGHEDGIVAFAATMQQAAEYLILTLEKALKIEQQRIIS